MRLKVGERVPRPPEFDAEAPAVEQGRRFSGLAPAAARRPQRELVALQGRRRLAAVVCGDGLLREDAREALARCRLLAPVAELLRQAAVRVVVCECAREVARRLERLAQLCVDRGTQCGGVGRQRADAPSLTAVTRDLRRPVAG